MIWIEIGFMNRIEIYLKMFKNENFPKLVFSNEMVRLRFVFCNNDSKMVLKCLYEL